MSSRTAVESKSNRSCNHRITHSCVAGCWRAAALWRRGANRWVGDISQSQQRAPACICCFFEYRSSNYMLIHSVRCRHIDVHPRAKLSTQVAGFWCWKWEKKSSLRLKTHTREDFVSFLWYSWLLLCWFGDRFGDLSAPTICKVSSETFKGPGLAVLLRNLLRRSRERYA